MRHQPRLCRICQGPLACQTHRCWRCGTHNPPAAGQPSILRAIDGGACPRTARDEAIARALAGAPPLPPSDAPDDPERWLDNDAGPPAETKPPELRLLR